VLGLEDEAGAFYSALEDSTTRVSPRSREFWRRAAQRDLNLRPDLEVDDERDNTIGLKFLREYELRRKEQKLSEGGNANKQDPAEVQITEEQQVEQDEKKELVEIDKISDTQDKSRLETTEKHEVKQDDEKELEDYSTGVQDLETTRGHKATEDVKEANSTS
jgi:hypothetical protein